MKRTIKLAVVAALALGATSAFATNGSVMIGVGAKARGMGGVGIATGMGAESGYSNPALITSIKGDNEISFGGTLFMPDIETSNSLGGPSSSAESDADTFVIPSVSLASKVNDNFYWGLGMWGTGGLGVDYRDEDTSALGGNHMQMVTALQLMQFGAPLAYTTNGFSVGITPIIQYSSLDINYANPMAADAQVGSGVADDIAFGFNVGMAYEISGLTIGAVYKSEITFDIDNVLSNAVNPMVAGGGGSYNQDEMSTPEQYGLGLSYTAGEHTIAVDWKYINWEDAEVYQDFNWEDQDVFAVGYEYATDGWALRCGYQYAESAFQEGPNSAALTGGPANLGNTFSMLGFPGTQETHITLGGSYVFNETLSMDLAAVYGLENEEKTTNFVGQEITTKHSEESYSIQLNYAF